MSALYLIRHGQGGGRQDYDRLSDLGREQSRLLGRYLKDQGVVFQATYSGSLERQRQTAEEACRICSDPQSVAIDAGWDEFDLGAVYRALAPRLSAEDPQFRRAFERQTAADRHWTSSDMAVVQAWIEGRYEFDGETWSQFRRRILEALEALRRRHGRGQKIAVFTSATPMAVVAAAAVGAPDSSIMKLAGVTYNSAMTTVRLEPAETTLFQFNATPHLTEARLRSFR